MVDSAAVQCGKQCAVQATAPCEPQDLLNRVALCCRLLDCGGRVLLAVVYLVNGSILELPSAPAFLAGHFCCELGMGI